jgi:hypothetical protein
VRALALAPSSAKPAACDKPGDFASRDDLGAFAVRKVLHAAVVVRAVRFMLECKVAALGGLLMARVHVKRPGDVVAVAETLAASGVVSERRPADLAEDRAVAYDALCAAEDVAFAAREGVNSGVAAIIPDASIYIGGELLRAVTREQSDGASSLAQGRRRCAPPSARCVWSRLCKGKNSRCIHKSIVILLVDF